MYTFSHTHIHVHAYARVCNVHRFAWDVKSAARTIRVSLEREERINWRRAIFRDAVELFLRSCCVTRDMLIIVIINRTREARVHNARVLSLAQYPKTNCRCAYYSNDD